MSFARSRRYWRIGSSPPPCIPAVYLFGSRVRGDHRPDSDVDVRLLLNEWNVCMDTAQWWLEQNRTNYDALRARLPGPFSPHREDGDFVDQFIREGRKSPVLVVRKAVCVWTPPKPGRAPQ